jgi:hypothetical protein
MELFIIYVNVLICFQIGFLKQNEYKKSKQPLHVLIVLHNFVIKTHKQINTICQTITIEYYW